MAETQTTTLEREFIIPLRRECMKVPAYRRGGRAVKAVKKFIAKHMKVEDRDLDKVKIDIYLNNEILFRGRSNPPSKIKVKASKEGGIVKVTLAESTKHMKFEKAKHEKRHQPAGSKKEAKKEEVKETAEEKEEKKEEKKEEVEKEKSVGEQHIKEAESQAKAQKHTIKVKPESHHRMALKK